jgi:hypothetical protein
MSFLKTRHILTTFSVVLCAGLIVSVNLNAAESSADKESDSKRPTRVKTILRPSFDPTVEKVELFEAMEEGAIDAFVVPHNEHHGYIFVENKSDKPVSVKLPRTIVAVQNLKQFGGGGGGFGGQGGQQGGFGGQGGQGGQQGGNQGVGGGQGGQQGGFGGQGGQGGGGFGQQGGGGGFFSVPPQHRVRLNLNSVCLEHGKDAPTKTMKYTLVPAEKVIKNDTLYELLSIVGSGQVSERAAQAAAWYLTDGLSFQQMANKQEAHFGGRTTSYFTQSDLVTAQQLLVFAKKQADDRRAAEAAGEKEEVDPYYSRESFKQ